MRACNYQGCIEIIVSRAGLADLLAGRAIDLPISARRSTNGIDDVITLKVPARLKRVGREMRMIGAAPAGRLG